MAILDDLRGLAAEDDVYLSRSIRQTSVTGGEPGEGFTSVYRGRLRQGPDGGWVFSTFTGQDGLVGFVLGQAKDYEGWTSTPTTTGNAVVSITRRLISMMDESGNGVLVDDSIVLSEVIPAAFVQ